MADDILEVTQEPPQKIKKPVTNSKIIWVILVIVIIIIAGFVIYQVSANKKEIEPTPVPVATTPIWQSKSEKNVLDFVAYFTLATNNESSTQNSAKARDLLTNGAQAILLTERDANGKEISDPARQLSSFVEVKPPVPKTLITNAILVDDKNAEITVSFMSDPPTVKIFSVSSEGEAWLIDKVRDWEESG